MRKRRRREHVGGGRVAEFQAKIAGLNKKEVIGVALEVSKEYHKVMVFDFTAEVIEEPFKIDVFLEGYHGLKEEIDRVVQERRGRKVLIGIEPTGPYHENLARYLKEDYEEVRFINPRSVYENRNQRMLIGLKTDDIDLGAIADLLIRGEGYDYNLEEGVYLELKEETYWREKKLKMRTQLKNQIRVRLDKIYPGSTSTHGGNEPLFKDLWDDRAARDLMRAGLTGQEILSLPIRSLEKRFRGAGSSLPRARAERMKDYFSRMLLPEEEVARIELDLLKRDVELLETLERQMGEVEEKMVEQVKESSASHLLGQIKGGSEVLIASFVGVIGDIKKYEWAGQIFSRSGLTPGEKGSGKQEGKGRPIRRAGNRFLRAILFKMAASLVKHNPYFGLYYEYLKEKRGKYWKKAQIAVANKWVRVSFAMIRDEAPFDPPTAKIDYLSELFRQTKRERKVRREKRRGAHPVTPALALKGHPSLGTGTPLQGQSYHR